MKPNLPCLKTRQTVPIGPPVDNPTWKTIATKRQKSLGLAGFHKDAQQLPHTLSQCKADVIALQEIRWAWTALPGKKPLHHILKRPTVMHFAMQISKNKPD